MEDRKLKFRVKPGAQFGPAGIHKAGDVVELTAEEAKGFLDKLIPLGDGAGLRNDLNMQIDPALMLTTPDETAGEEFSLQSQEEKPSKPKTQRKARAGG